MKINNSSLRYIFFVFITVLLYNCSSEPKIPVWELTKNGQQKSYLLASSGYLPKSDIDKMLSNKIIFLFDSCETYISLFDLEKSSLIEAKKWIEIGNNKTLKDTLSNSNFNLLKSSVELLNNKSELKFELPDSIKIKPQFYVNDLLNRNNNNFFNIEQFFFNRAMPQNKKITGFVSFQEYYKAYAGMDYNKYTEKLHSIESLYNEKKRIARENKINYKNEKFDELEKSQSVLLLNPKTVITDNWINKIESETTKRKSFILLDAKYINPGNKNGIYKKLLSKGYKLTRVN